MITYIIIYLIGYVISYIMIRYEMKRNSFKYTKLDRLVNLLVSSFSWIIIPVALVIILQPLKGMDDEASW